VQWRRRCARLPRRAMRTARWRGSGPVGARRCRRRRADGRHRAGQSPRGRGRRACRPRRGRRGGSSPRRAGAVGWRGPALTRRRRSDCPQQATGSGATDPRGVQGRADLRRSCPSDAPAPPRARRCATARRRRAARGPAPRPPGCSLPDPRPGRAPRPWRAPAVDPIRRADRRPPPRGQGRGRAGQPRAKAQPPVASSLVA
jgi:hypothetical protein